MEEQYYKEYGDLLKFTIRHKCLGITNALLAEITITHDDYRRDAVQFSKYEKKMADLKYRIATMKSSVLKSL